MQNIQFTFEPLVVDTLDDLKKYLTNQFMQLQQVLQIINDQLTIYPERTSPPVRPKLGMIAFADGVNWNPGQGRNLYIYSNATPTDPLDWLPLINP